MRNTEEILYVRVPRKLLERLDAEAQRQREAHPGEGRSRADIVRSLLLKALDEREAHAASRAA